MGNARCIAISGSVGQQATTRCCANQTKASPTIDEPGGPNQTTSFA